MPEIKIQHVVSCSSEDKNNPADNLKKPEGSYKWKCAAPGEKSISVVLQFEKACQISAIDIGNEGSAFVEVLVGKSTASGDQDYQVILVASSFMSPLESRNGTNRNSVRIFGADKLSKMVASEKWDRVKIVCTQQFNKTSQFGLSFIKFHSPSDGKEGETKPAGQQTLGAFRLKSESGDDIPVGTLFAHRKEKTEPTPLKGAAAVRAASKLAEDSKPATPKPSVTLKPSVPSSRSAETKPSPAKRKHNVSSDEEEAPAPAMKTPLRKQSTSISSTSTTSSRHSHETPPPLKKTKSEPPKPSPSKEFSKLMENVVFVISGFQNPYRGEIREKALEMGAKYRPDWGRGCTHLICAFANTPKYNQVQGKGIIVKKDWITDSFKHKRLLPWRKYRLGDADSPSESSEDEAPVTPVSQKPVKRADSTSSKGSASKLKTQTSKASYGGETDSGEDTEDEIRRAKERVAKQEAKEATPPAPKTKGDNPYGDSTDEDEPKKGSTKDDSSDSGLPDLPDFFADKVFMFYGDFPTQEKRLLTRYIAAYDGTTSDYMSDKVSYVVTQQSWDDNFEEALSENPNLVFVKPKWIRICHEKTKMVPHQPFIVVPK
ncbi:DNA repair protein XRCC1-like [Gigantopelta aegis]|uniref:DNA repair protein XRCC1-like n=1 Tax=Gigantopelta aegis TaxID=1735272 RepID=UPI001B8894D1|nr:DNA repair protein XRCC1-like [Gigantopelta aegis]